MRRGITILVAIVMVLSAFAFSPQSGITDVYAANGYPDIAIAVGYHQIEIPVGSGQWMDAVTINFDEYPGAVSYHINIENGQYTGFTWEAGQYELWRLIDDGIREGRLENIGTYQVDVIAFDENQNNILAVGQTSVEYTSAYGIVHQIENIAISDEGILSWDFESYLDFFAYVIYINGVPYDDVRSESATYNLLELVGQLVTEGYLDQSDSYEITIKAQSQNNRVLATGDVLYNYDHSSYKTVWLPNTTFTYSGEPQGLSDGRGYTVSGTTSATDAGTYEAIATLADGFVWGDDGTTGDKTIEWEIIPATIYVDSPTYTAIYYNGEEQGCITERDGYILSGTTKAVEVGEYTAIATLVASTDPNYVVKWKSDNSTSPKTIEWKIYPLGRAFTIDKVEFGSSGSWNNSYAQEWCSMLYEKMFSEEEKALILDAEVHDGGLDPGAHLTADDGKDLVFFLSKYEIDKYYLQGGSAPSATPAFGGTANHYWLRDRVIGNSVPLPGSVYVVNWQGRIGATDPYDLLYARPALYLDLSSDIEGYFHRSQDRGKIWYINDSSGSLSKETISASSLTPRYNSDGTHNVNYDRINIGIGYPLPTYYGFEGSNSWIVLDVDAENNRALLLSEHLWKGNPIGAENALPGQDAPVGLTGLNASSKSAKDGAITGVADTMEYRAAGAVKWTKVSGDKITGLAAGDYEIRYKAVNLSKKAGESVVIIVGYDATLIKVVAPTGKNLTYNGKSQTGVDAGEGYTLSRTTSATNAGSYQATATLKDGYVWSDGKNEPKTISWKINKATVNVTAPAGKKLTYNGKTQTGVAAGTNYTLSGTTKATKAGTYTAKATLKSNANYTYKWSDGTTAAKTIKWTINKAGNPLTIKAKTATVKYTAVKKNAQTLAVGKVITFTKKGQGKMIYTKVSGNKKITINKTTGKVTVKKGLKKGTYKVKVKVRAAGNTNYKASAWKTVTFKVKVK